MTGSLRLLLLTVALGSVQLPLAGQQSEVPIDSVIVWGGRVTLEEPSGVLATLPVVRTNGSEILLTDLREGWVRVYEISGQLRHHLDLDLPGVQSSAYVSAPFGGDLWIGFEDGSLALLSGSGEPLRTVAGATATEIMDLVVTDTHVAAGTRFRTRDAYRGSLSFLDRSNFQPAADQLLPTWEPELDPTFRLTTWTRLSAGPGDSLAAVVSTLDSLFFFGGDGQFGRSVRIESSRIGAATAIPSAFFEGDRAVFRQWMASTPLVSEIAWIAGDALLVQYQTSSDNTNLYGLLCIDPHNGGVKWEVADSPRLLTAAPDGSLLFVDPSGSSVAALRWARLLHC